MGNLSNTNASTDVDEIPHLAALSYGTRLLTNHVPGSHQPIGGAYIDMPLRQLIAPHQQQGGTCYAYAVASAIRATQMRIVGRQPDNHKKIVKDIIVRHGSDGGNTFKVCGQQCQKRQLSCEEIQLEQAVKALKDGRCVLAKYKLSSQGWNKNRDFFKFSPTGVLEFEQQDYGDQGHAVLIIGQTQHYWKIKNSWGSKFADNGYFRYAKDTRMKFMDVYYRVCDLTQNDLMNYEREKKNDKSR